VIPSADSIPRSFLPSRIGRARAVLIASLVAALSCAARADWEAPANPPTHGVAAEVAPTTATIWARCDRPTGLHCALLSSAGEARWLTTGVDAAHDFTGKLTFDRLALGTSYEYRVWCSTKRPNDARAPNGESGRLVTPPAPDAARALRFVWGGDLGGQNACRDAAEGYTVLDRVREQSPDFFVALGDMVYADDACRKRGRFGNEQVPGPSPAAGLEGYWEQWRYNRDDPSLRRLFSALPYYAVWDDHEINTDAGPHHDVSPRAPGRHLLPIARRAFLDYQPIAEPAPRLYRSLRWGRHLEMFLLDTRGYRDANSAADDPRRPKTLLGAEQRSWLLEGLTRSDATWKVVVCGVPISVPTSSEERGRDGWANGDGPGGFENELRSILLALRERGVRNLVFLSTDVHFATAFRYTPFADDRAFSFHEFISGPLNAGVFARPDLDSTFGPDRLFFHGPDEEIADFAEAKTWFNFGVVEVSEEGRLRVRYVDANGREIWQGELSASPRGEP
jgi:alkaline phosphatase D